MSERGTFEVILGEVGQALLPLRDAVSSPQAFYAFLLKLGWQASDIPQPLRDLGTGLETLFDTLRKLLGDGLNVSGSVSVGSNGSGGATTISADDIARAVEAVQQVINGIRGIAAAPDAAFPAALVADNFKQTFPRQLIDYLVVTYLQTYHGSLAFAFRALGVIKAEYTAPVGQRLAHVHYKLDFSDLPTVLCDPAIVLQNAFGWGTPNLDTGALISQVDNLLTALHIDTRIETLATASRATRPTCPAHLGARCCAASSSSAPATMGVCRPIFAFCRCRRVVRFCRASL